MINKEYIINNTTPGGTQQIHLLYTVLSINDIVNCADKSEYIRKLCKQGCVNYNKKWSCPPFSQSFENIISHKSYSNGIVIVGYINLDDMKYIKKTYQKIKAANIILKSKIEKYTRKIEKLCDGYAFLSGSCNLCKPCKKKLNLPCKKPQLRRYSLESTGINVEQLTSEYCNHNLLWYKKNSLIEYTSVVTMVLFNNNSNLISTDDFLYCIQKNIFE